MNIFEQLADIITKKQNRLASNVEDESEFVPYMTQRWLSMYSPQFAKILNASSNVLWRAMDDKQMWYKFFTSVVPKDHNKRIRYFKKAQKGNKKAPDSELVEHLANSLELSRREIKIYIEQGSINLKEVKKRLNIS